MGVGGGGGGGWGWGGAECVVSARRHQFTACPRTLAREGGMVGGGGWGGGGGGGTQEAMQSVQSI